MMNEERRKEIYDKAIEKGGKRDKETEWTDEEEEE